MLVALRLVILGIFENRYCYFKRPNLPFGMLVASALASWGTLGRPWGTCVHKKGHFGVQASIFHDLVLAAREWPSTLRSLVCYVQCCSKAASFRLAFGPSARSASAGGALSHPFTLHIFGIDPRTHADAIMLPKLIRVASPIELSQELLKLHKNQLGWPPSSNVPGIAKIHSKSIGVATLIQMNPVM